MDMLDATLAFALTLAALATTVTIILEAIYRMLRIRKWNLILTLKKLSEEIASDRVFSGKTNWDFVVNVLNNGACPGQKNLLTSREILADNVADMDSTKSGSGFVSFIKNSSLRLLFKFRQKPNNKAEVTNDKVAKTSAAGVVSSFMAKMFTFSYENHQLPNKDAKDEDKNWLDSIKSIPRNSATRGVFDKVSLEHVLRRFSEQAEVREKLADSRELVEAQLDKIARKYEEFASSVTADFKRRSQLWSILIGIFIALAANVNAVRIFEGYLIDKNLSARVIGNFEQFESIEKEAQKKLDEALAKKKTDSQDKYTDKISAKQKTIKELIGQRGKLTGNALKTKNTEIEKAQLELNNLIKLAYAESEAGKARQALNNAGENLRSISALGVPIGINYYPHCVIFGSDKISRSGNEKIRQEETNSKSIFDMLFSLPERFMLWMSGSGDVDDDATKSNERKSENICLPGQEDKLLSLSFVAWLISTGLTGILIGMGAPFWFDVARRVAEVRSMFGGNQDNEKRLSGKDVNGDQEKRKELVKNIADDAVADDELSKGKSGNHRDLLNPEPLQGPIARGEL